jgi:hypothetical protein
MLVVPMKLSPDFDLALASCAEAPGNVEAALAESTS